MIVSSRTARLLGALIALAAVGALFWSVQFVPPLDAEGSVESSMQSMYTTTGLFVIMAVLVLPLIAGISNPRFFADVIFMARFGLTIRQWRVAGKHDIGSEIDDSFRRQNGRVAASVYRAAARCRGEGLPFFSRAACEVLVPTDAQRVLGKYLDEFTYVFVQSVKSARDMESTSQLLSTVRGDSASTETVIRYLGAVKSVKVAHDMLVNGVPIEYAAAFSSDSGAFA